MSQPGSAIIAAEFGSYAEMSVSKDRPLRAGTPATNVAVVHGNERPVTREFPPSHYQSFEPGEGSSDSIGKLAALKLPDLSGKRFLDLGCNHGFFCFAALERGASEAIGVDRDPDAINAATARAKAIGLSDKARFVRSNWNDFNEGGFDCIILLSALHYAEDQPALLAKIAGMLKPDGMLILEAGTIRNKKRKWTSLIRGKPPRTDMVEYPDPTHLFEVLSENYAPRDMGQSVLQPGDNIPRTVWHCQKRRRIIDVVTGPSRVGKSTLALSFKRKGVPVIDVDMIVHDERNRDTPLGQSIRKVFKIGELHKCFDQIAADGLMEDLATITIEAIVAIPMNVSPTVVVMSVVFMNQEFMHHFQKLAAETGAIVWESRRVV